MERGSGFFLCFYSSFSFSMLAFFSCKSQKKLFPHNGVRSWLAYPKSLCFQVFSMFLIFRDRTRCTVKSICSREDKKKNFPLLFLIRRDRARCTAKSIHSREDKKKNFPLLFLIRRDRTRCTTKSIRSQGRKQSKTKKVKI